MSEKIENVTVTYQQVANFRANARKYLELNPEQSKLQYALQKMLKKTEPVHNEFFDKEQEIRIELAETDKNGVLIQDEKIGYSYSPKNAKDLTKKLRELSDTKAEVTPYIPTSLPKQLDAKWFEFFVPFVLEDKEPE